MELTIENAQKALGKGIFKLFDYIKTSLPEAELEELRFCNRRCFNLYDKYVTLREIHKALSGHIKQFILGISNKDYAPLRDLINKGVEKGIEESRQKLKFCHGVDQITEDQGGQIADLFDLVYERFEKEIEDFFSQRENDV